MAILKSFPRRLVVLAVILSGILLIAWSIRFDKLINPQISNGSREKITLAAYAGSYGFLPFIAQEKGYFAANGLDVILKINWRRKSRHARKPRRNGGC